MIDNQNQGKIFHYDGVSWTEQITTNPFRMQGIHGTGPNDVYAIGSNGPNPTSFYTGIYHYDGTSWTLIVNNTGQTAFGKQYSMMDPWAYDAHNVFFLQKQGFAVHKECVLSASLAPTGDLLITVITVALMLAFGVVAVFVVTAWRRT
jgi:hypothetical protein